MVLVRVTIFLRFIGNKRKQTDILVSEVVRKPACEHRGDHHNKEGGPECVELNGYSADRQADRGDKTKVHSLNECSNESDDEHHILRACNSRYKIEERGDQIRDIRKEREQNSEMRTVGLLAYVDRYLILCPYLPRERVDKEEIEQHGKQTYYHRQRVKAGRISVS